MQIEIDEEQRLELIDALRLAAHHHYRDAWIEYGPHGRHPDPRAHATLMGIGDRALAFAVNVLGDTDPDHKEIVNGRAEATDQGTAAVRPANC